MSVKEGTLLWEPSERLKKEAVITDYITWLNTKKNLSITAYDELWNWSVQNTEEFWESIWDYYEVKSYTDYKSVLEKETMPGAKWFDGASLNYAEHILRNAEEGKVAIYSKSETRPYSEITWDQLLKQTASVASYLKKIGVKPGDRVASYMPNIPETVVAFLATASIGAIWSSCAPEFGLGSTLDRFKQIKPKVLFAVDGYQYNGKPYLKMDTVLKLQNELSSLKQTIIVPYLNTQPDIRGSGPVSCWSDMLGLSEKITFEKVPFDHPLWILYSSGTTGLPKAIVHGHGGITLSMLLKNLQADLTPDDRFFWYTTTGWMMWNTVVGSLITGASIVLYDGSPTYPDMGVLWRLAEKTKMTSFGTSPSYILNCMKKNLEPGKTYDVSSISTFAYTGSPLSPEGFKWIYDHVKADVRVAPSSGGTDLCASIVASNVLSPLHAGEIPCRSLGVSVYSYDEAGKPIYNEMGEMVITKPYPSMPLYFWNDRDGQRYHESYFNVYPGIWRHGDLLKINKSGSAVIYGRSDATINRMGVRTGSSEIYNAVEGIPEVLDSLVVDLSGYYHEPYMPLFVVVRDGDTLTADLKRKINAEIRDEVSPRHIPDDIFEIREVPRTLTGKKMEIPVRKILLGQSLDKAVSKDAMKNPHSINYFLHLSRKLNDNILG
ncbi:acetoacetate--CoA ligase [Virgibacillus kimchii]